MLIRQRQAHEGWGTKVISRLADDLRTEFPQMRGLSQRNLVYMRTFADQFPQPIAQQAVAQLPCGHVTQDLYCSIKKGSSPLLGSLGSILSTAPSSGTSDQQVGGNSWLATALVSDFSQADLAGISDAAGDLTSQLSTPDGTVDLAQVTASATALTDTLSPLAELLGSGAANPAANGQLAAAPAGTPRTMPARSSTAPANPI